MKLRNKLLLAGSVVVLAGAIGFWGWDASTKTALAAALERCRAAGLPVTVDDLRPPPVPDADNAALVLNQLEPLFKALPAPAGSESLGDALADFEQAHPSIQLDEAGKKELTALLDNQPVRDVLARIHEATAKPAYNAHLNYEKGLGTILQSPSRFLNPARFLVGEARLAVLRGQTDEACTEVWNLTLLADHSGHEPIVVSQLFRFAIWRMALDEIEKLAGSGSMPIAWNQRFAERLERLDLTGPLAQSLDGERVAFGQIVFGQLLARKEQLGKIVSNMDVHLFSLMGVKAWLNLESYRIPGVLRLEEAEYIDLMRETRSLIADTSRGYRETDQQLKTMASAVSPNRLMLKVLSGTIGGINTKLWEMRARINCAKVGLALERFRQAKGDYPATLAALVPDYLPKVPPDIFTNQPLIYRTEPGGAVVYSVGPNLRDDGGGFDKATDKDDQGWFAGTAAARKYAPPPASP
jgi:hypothetical protein